MTLERYRRVFALPGVPTSMLLMFFARVPMAAMGITLTLHVVTELGRGYGQAGLIGTLAMLGAAGGSPLLGRLIDRHGLRPVVAVSALVSASYWIAAPWLPYPALLLVALPAGLLAVPSSNIAKQVLAALVPAEQRRTAYAVDSVSVELAFMIGPAATILLATQLSSTVALTSLGVCFGLVGVALWWMNPPIRSADEEPTVGLMRPAVRSWLTARLMQALLIAFGALFVLMGMEIAMLAALREAGDVDWTSLVLIIMCAASVLGGIVYGAARRSFSQLTLMVLLAALVVPAGIGGGTWWLLAVLLIPTNLACAPTLAATSERVISLAPASVRGSAVGLQDASVRLGLALGAPVVGFVIDHSSAVWGFAAAGGGGLLVAAVAWAVGAGTRTQDTRAPTQDTRAPTSDTRARTSNTVA